MSWTTPCHNLQPTASSVQRWMRRDFRQDGDDDDDEYQLPVTTKKIAYLLTTVQNVMTNELQRLKMTKNAYVIPASQLLFEHLYMCLELSATSTTPCYLSSSTSALRSPWSMQVDSRKWWGCQRVTSTSDCCPHEPNYSSSSVSYCLRKQLAAALTMSLVWTVAAESIYRGFRAGFRQGRDDVKQASDAVLRRVVCWFYFRQVVADQERADQQTSSATQSRRRCYEDRKSVV